MKKYSSLLEKLTPFSPALSRKEIITRLARIHGELVVIHPFRDGNGRVTRMLGNLLLMQAERKPIQQEVFYGKSLREEYYQAIREVWRQAEYSLLIAFLDRLLPRN